MRCDKQTNKTRKLQTNAHLWHIYTRTPTHVHRELGVYIPVDHEQDQSTIKIIDYAVVVASAPRLVPVALLLRRAVILQYDYYSTEKIDLPGLLDA